MRRLVRMPIVCRGCMGRRCMGGQVLASPSKWMRKRHERGSKSLAMRVSTAPQASYTKPATRRTWHRLSRRSARSGYLPHSARISELSVCSCSPLAVAAPAAPPPPPAPARGDDGGEPPLPAAAADAACAAPAALLPAAAPAAAPAAEAEVDAEAELGWRRARRLTRSTASSSRCSWVHIEMSMSCIWSLGTTPCGQLRERWTQIKEAA